MIMSYRHPIILRQCMNTLLKVFLVFGLLMGLLGLGIMFLSSSPASITTNKTKNSEKAAAQVAEDAYRDDMAKFKQEFPSLKKTVPNLRWFDDDAGGKGTDAVESVYLVTPFGPCILMAG